MLQILAFILGIITHVVAVNEEICNPVAVINEPGEFRGDITVDVFNFKICEMNWVNVGHVYKISPRISGVVSLSTCHPETGFDTRLIVYSADCERFDTVTGCIVENDDDPDWYTLTLEFMANYI